MRRVSDFEYTSECIIFDLLEIGLYHGWLVDPQDEENVKAVGKCSYNQLVEKIIQYKQSDNDEMVREGESVVVVWGERVGGVNMTSAS